MINKLKIGFLVAVLSLAVGVSSANAANLTYDSYVDVYVSATDRTMTIKPTSYATSLVTGTSSIAVVVPTSSNFYITSQNNIGVSAAGGTDASSNVCAANTNTLTIPGDSAITYTLTPGAGVCNTGGGGGGGGGGGSYSAPAATPVVAVAPAVPAVAPATPATPVASTYNVAVLGTTTLKNGSKGDSVKELQKVLNKILSVNLAVDGKLGPKTIAQIKAWQKAHGLKADGLVGKLTKAAMVAEANK